eukprot:scaffold37838_cov58-Phaeocystis_antarctica.AAC.2
MLSDPLTQPRPQPRPNPNPNPNPNPDPKQALHPAANCGSDSETDVRALRTLLRTLRTLHTLRSLHTLRTLLRTLCRVEYFIALVTESHTPWRSSVASHDISPDPSFNSNFSVRETLQLHVQAAGGALAFRAPE